MTAVDARVLPVTSRQREVLDLVSRGLEREEIALVLGISIDTVKTQASRLYRRLDVHNAAEAVRVGFERGLLSPRDPVDPTVGR